MRNSFFPLLFVLCLFSQTISAKQPLPWRNLSSGGLRFTENKGQIHDQNRQARPDVLFTGTDGALVFHLRNKGISYQLQKMKGQSVPGNPDRFRDPHYKEKYLAEQLSIYRIDINWLNSAEQAAVSKSSPFADVSNYYTEEHPNGLLDVKSYAEVSYRNVYPGIDLRWHEEKGRLKYDYLLSPGADHRQILLEIKGSEKTFVTEKGELQISTPLGDIVEEAPIVLQAGKELHARWKVTQKGRDYVVSFEIEKADPALPLIIDPVVRNWGTYYGGTGTDWANGVTTDATGNVYMVGYSNSSAGTIIATTGSHQQSIGAMYDAYLVKFNAAGVRQWATYYGGSLDDFGYACACDPSGNVFFSGYTSSNVGTAIATASSHQPVLGGTSDAFLVKFNSSGVRQWGTYYGGTVNDQAFGCSCDPSGNVYISGTTDSNTGTAIATASSHQPIQGGGGGSDAFLAKFDPSGNRLWGTYYGDSGGDGSNCCYADAAGFVYMAGSSMNSTGTIIATATSHQPVVSGSYDAFLAKFDANGVRQWGTYYGGSAFETSYTCHADAAGNVYMGGSTQTNIGTLFATPSAHQGSYGGGISDGFAVKFSPAGVRLWGTYYGGTGLELIMSGFSDASGNVYFAGSTTTSGGTAIATPANHQPVFGGGSDDGFFVKFDAAGVRQWGTYYGGASSEEIRACAMSPSGEMYLAGASFYVNATTTAVATPASHQPVNGSIYDAFLAQLSECIAPAPANTTPTVNLVLCAGNSTTLQASSSGTISWYSSATGTNALSTGTAFITSTLTAGTHTVYAEAFTCAPSYPRTLFTITVNPLPSLTVSASSNTICAGSSVTLSASGASSYTWLPNSFTSTLTDSPASTSDYTLQGTDAVSGCTNSAVKSITVIAMPTVTASVSSSTICAGISTTLSASGTASGYLWQPGFVSGPSFVVSPANTTTYTVTANIAACTKSTAITVSVSPTPNLTVQTSPPALCIGESATLTATGTASGYTWQPGSFSGSSYVISPGSTSTYTVTGNIASCTNSTTVVMLVYALPSLTIQASAASLCAGETNTLTVSGANSYSWEPGGPGSSILITPSITTSYSVTGLSANNCSSSQVFTQQVDPCTGLPLQVKDVSVLKIFPNPFSDTFHVVVTGKTVFSLEVVNALGQTVLKTEIEGEAELDLGDQAAGIYFVRCGAVITKLVKQ